MATGTDAIIFAALLTRLEGLPAALPISTPGITFPPTGQTKPAKYLKFDFMPNRTRQVTMGDDPQEKVGLAQVSVMWPLGSAIIDAQEVADQVISRFKNQTIFASGVKITISSEPWASRPIKDEDRMNIPVSIPYIAFEPET
ncbi:phage tail terminator-like protein [Neorhizobium vignae]|uniref:phage tail terminator-like protein n=1 Tax=Neorhizobium vignae TaxID=690585 RepID=UPI00055E2DF1|nr:phage tail terminator-like protein [Neorhizobium vignae]